MSPALADLMMEHLETNVLKNLRFKPKFYFRYVDDILLTIPNSQIEDTLRRFNNFNCHIKFTHELEVEGKIPFLDVLIVRQNDLTLSTDWYHKSTWSGRYLSFNSNLPFTYKRNTVLILAEKIFKLSALEFHQKNVDLLTTALEANNYPRKLIQDLIHEKYKQVMLGSSNREERPVRRYVSIPYVKGVFEKIKYVFKQREVEVVGRPANLLKNEIFSKTKDKVPLEVSSGVVYKIDCDTCCSSYIGESMQYLKTREYQHKYNIRMGNVTHSALAEHGIRNPTHNINWGKHTILDKEQNTFKRKLKEAVYIKRQLLGNQPCLNSQLDCANLNGGYMDFI